MVLVFGHPVFHVIVHLMKLHGIHCRPDLSVDEQQYILLRHLVGNCFRSAEHNRSLPHGSCVDIVCGDLSSAFPSATDMSIAFLCCIIDDISTDQKLTKGKLSALATAFTVPNLFLHVHMPNEMLSDSLCKFLRVSLPMMISVFCLHIWKNDQSLI